MKVSFKLSDPRSLPVTVQFTSTIAELETLTPQLQDHWPANRLKGALETAIFDAKRTFYGEGKAE